MSTYNARVPADQQYQLSMEPPKKACYDIPDPVSREDLILPAVQEVARLNLSRKTDSAPSELLVSSKFKKYQNSRVRLLP